MRTEKQKMLVGELYDPLDPELARERQRCRDLLERFNDTREDQERTESLRRDDASRADGLRRLEWAIIVAQ